MTQRINITDWERIQAQYSSLYQTIENGMSRMSYVERNVDFTSPYYFGLNVPNGREFFIFNRELKIANGDYDIDVVIPADGFTGGTEAYTSTLRPLSVTTIETKLYGGVSPQGSLTIADVDFVDTGTDTGNRTSGGASAIEGVILSITGQSCLRITRHSGDGDKVGIRLLVWETAL